MTTALETQAERVHQLCDTASKVAAELSDLTRIPWTVHAPDDRAVWPKLTATNDATLMLSTGYDTPERRIKISNIPNVEPGVRLDWHTREPIHYSITVAWDRTPAAIAKEIMRRLITDARRVEALAVKTNVLTLEGVSKRGAAASQLAAMIGGTIRGADTARPHESITVYGAHCCRYEIAPGGRVTVERLGAIDAQAAIELEQILERCAQRHTTP